MVLRGRLTFLTEQRADPDTPEKPAYFRYLTLMAFHVFLQEKVSRSFHLRPTSCADFCFPRRSTPPFLKSVWEEPTTAPTSFHRPSPPA